MTVTITEEPLEVLARYARLPIAFEVRERFRLVQLEQGLGGIRLVPETVAPPYVKDYDADPANHPSAWPARFDVSRWGVLLAWRDGEQVGGAVIAWDSPGLEMSGDAHDAAVLWDLRVAPGVRGQGIGRAIFRGVEGWAAARGARQLLVETQNTNVPACRFYARQGCTLCRIDRLAYPGLPDEAQLLWCKDLVAGGERGGLADVRHPPHRSSSGIDAGGSR